MLILMFICHIEIQSIMQNLNIVLLCRLLNFNCICVKFNFAIHQCSRKDTQCCKREKEKQVKFPNTHCQVASIVFNWCQIEVLEKNFVIRLFQVDQYSWGQRQDTVKQRKWLEWTRLPQAHSAALDIPQAPSAALDIPWLVTSLLRFAPGFRFRYCY